MPARRSCSRPRARSQWTRGSRCRARSGIELECPLRRFQVGSPLRGERQASFHTASLGPGQRFDKFFEIWVPSALREIFGKFGPVAGLSAGDKSLRKFWTFIAHWPPQPTPAKGASGEQRDRRWPSPAVACTPHACSDAAEPIFCSMRLHLVAPVGRVLRFAACPPCF